MAKVDRAGIVSKRFDGEAWPFARLGGTCPRWDAHEEQAPDAVAAQLIETMDGRRFVSLTVGLPREGGARGRSVIALGCEAKHGRSEEHTSELQSLMRISYAVFCLKKKIRKSKKAR